VGAMNTGNGLSHRYLEETVVLPEQLI